MDRLDQPTLVLPKIKLICTVELRSLRPCLLNQIHMYHRLTK
jgi:hypothetical protein